MESYSKLDEKDIKQTVIERRMQNKQSSEEASYLGRKTDISNPKITSKDSTKHYGERS